MEKRTLLFIGMIVFVLFSINLISPGAYAGTISVEQEATKKLDDKGVFKEIYEKHIGSWVDGTTGRVHKFYEEINGDTKFKTDEYPTTPLLIVKDKVANCSDATVTKHLTVNQTNTITSEWSLEDTISIGSEASISGGVPFGVDVEFTVTADFSATKSHSYSHSKTLSWEESTDVDVKPYKRVLTQFVVEGKEQADIPFTVDFYVVGKTQIQYEYPRGTLTFHADNNGHGTLLGKYHDDKERKMNLKDCCMKNDEIRSMKFFHSRPGTIVRVYDSPDGSHDDDWCEIKIKKMKDEIVIDSFERDHSNEYYSQDFHHHNGLDGKISYVKILTGDRYAYCDIDIENYLSKEERHIQIKGTWKGSGAVEGDWKFSDDPNFSKADCADSQESGGKQTIHHPDKVEKLPGRQIKSIKVRPK